MLHLSKIFPSIVLLSAAVCARPAPEKRTAGQFQFYTLPTALSGPCDLAEGPDGALWGEDILIEKIFRLDPQTTDITEYDIPFTTPLSNVSVPGVSSVVQDRLALSCAIRSGADGNIYAANGVRNQLVRINPTTKAIKVFEPTPADPAGNLFPFNDLYTAADGIYLTQTTGNIFQFFSFATETFTSYQIPTANSLPIGVYVASNGDVYIPEFLGNKILIFNPSIKSIKEYPLPTLLQGPAVVRAEHDGYVYFTLFEGDGLGRISMSTNDIQLFATDQLGGLGSEDTVDSSGNVWLSFFTLDSLAKLDTTSLTYTYVPFPDTFAAAGASGLLGDVPPNVDVAVNYGPGDKIWFTSILDNQVGSYSLS